MIKFISVEEFIQLKDANVIDVRTPAEFSDQFLAGSTNLPLSELEVSDCQHLPSDATIYLLCGTGMRAQKAAGSMLGRVSQPLRVVQGGIKALEFHGHPLEQSAGKELK
jgi:rhodanese-related sulfurtransferase